MTERGAEISKPGEQSRDQEMTTLVVCTLVGDVSNGMKIKDGIFEAERKENGQEVVMKSFGRKNSYYRRRLERKQYLCSPLILCSSNIYEY